MGSEAYKIKPRHKAGANKLASEVEKIAKSIK